MTHGPNVGMLGMCYAKVRPACCVASGLFRFTCKVDAAHVPPLLGCHALHLGTRSAPRHLGTSAPRHTCLLLLSTGAQAPKVDPAYAARLLNYGKHQASLTCQRGRRRNDA